MRRGTVVWINLEDASPPELSKTRPGIIISNSEQNALLDTVVVIPLSTRAPEIWPLRIRVPLRSRKPNFAIIPGVRQVSKARLLDVIEITPAQTLAQLHDAIGAYLDD